MSRPSDEELKIALSTAVSMREKGADPDFMGKSLLNMNYRIHHLEKVLHAAKTFLHNGLDPRQETDLLRAIEKAEKASAFLTDEEENNFL